MRSLLWKELRQLAPLGGFWGALLLLSYFFVLATERPDQQTYPEWCDALCIPGNALTAGLVLAVMTLTIAYGLYPREHDESTIDFLRSLPVSPGAIFLGKVLAAWLLLFGLILIGYAADALLLALNTESIDGRFYPRLHATLWFRDLTFATIVLAHGVFLSWFRTAGLVLYAAYYLLLLWLETRLGDAGLFSVLQILDTQYQGEQLQLHWPAIGVHLGVAAVLLLLASLLWSRQEVVSVSRPARSARLRIGGALLSLLGFMVVAFWLVNQTGDGRFGDGEAGRIETAHYRFIYPQWADAEAASLATEADADYQRLAMLLDAGSFPGIRVNLGAQGEHIAGRAAGSLIAMDVRSGPLDKSVWLRRVLSHETVHVFQGFLSGGRLWDGPAGAGFFVEGMAQHLSFLVVPDNTTRALNWHLAAVAWEHQSIRFADLLEGADFERSYDAELYYSLADVWASALADICGESIFARVLGATASDRGLSDLSPGLFWRSLLHSLDCDVSSVNAAWQQRLGSIYRERGSAAFPKFTDISIDRDGEDHVVLRGTLDPADPASVPPRFYLRIRRDTAFKRALEDNWSGRVERQASVVQVRFRVPLRATGDHRFDYQLGFVPTLDSRVYYERWRSGVVPPERNP